MDIWRNLIECFTFIVVDYFCFNIVECLIWWIIYLQQVFRFFSCWMFSISSSLKVLICKLMNFIFMNVLLYWMFANCFLLNTMFIIHSFSMFFSSSLFFNVHNFFFDASVSVYFSINFLQQQNLPELFGFSELFSFPPFQTKTRIFLIISHGKFSLSPLQHDNNFSINQSKWNGKRLQAKATL